MSQKVTNSKAFCKSKVEANQKIEELITDKIKEWKSHQERMVKKRGEK